MSGMKRHAARERYEHVSATSWYAAHELFSMQHLCATHCGRHPHDTVVTGISAPYHESEHHMGVTTHTPRVGQATIWA